MDRPPPPVGTLDAAAVRRYWDEVLTLIRRRRQKSWAVVREASVRDVQGDEIVLLFRHAVHANMLAGETELLLDALHEVLGGTWRVRPEVGGDDRGGPATAPAARTDPDPTPARVAQPTPDGWPEPARPGGSAPPAPPPSPKARESRSTPRTGRATPAAATRARVGAAPADEPPFDPDYDRGAYGGFDPGDEPLEDGAPAVRESSEEQALRAVTEHFAVERIGDTGPRS